MNFTRPPILKAPSRIKRIPAIKVAAASPEYPNFSITLKTMTANAPVGPPICTRLPPKKEMQNPAIIAVNNPRSGPTPLAIAKAIASGSATMPTMIPAIKSLVKSFTL